MCVIDWLWLFVSLFGLKYHVPFRLSKIHVDYLVRTKAGRGKSQLDLLSVLFLNRKPLLILMPC